jgi:hypothetical protein
MLTKRTFKPGDWVIYRKFKQTAHPGPRAQKIRASSKGDVYTYAVNKFWVVKDVSPNEKGRLTLATRRGKTHEVEVTDPNLRRANLWERIRFRNRFMQQ